jgi:hypothetical protein
VTNPDANAKISALSIAEMLEKRMTFRRVMKTSIEKIMAAKGVSGSYAALKLSDSGGNITLNGGGGGFLVSTLSGTGTAALEATSVGVVQRTTSDARLKTDVMRISSREALELVVALEPVRYNWIDQERRGAQREIGLVAQQVQPYVPEIISADDGGNLNLNYPRLTALLIGAIQELTARVAELEAAR